MIYIYIYDIFVLFLKSYTYTQQNTVNSVAKLKYYIVVYNLL